jgi:hypothetical protein
MSVIIKADLREKLTATRKAFDKQIKEREAAANKEVSRASYLRDIALILTTWARLWTRLLNISRVMASQKRSSPFWMLEVMPR